MSYPTTLNFGPVTVYFQSLFLILAIFFGVFLFWRSARKEGFDGESILDLALAVVIVGLIGGRISFVLMNFSVFRGDWLDVFRSFRSGLNFFGALVFALVFSLLYCRRKGWSFFKILDLAAFPAAVGRSLGALGVLFSRLSLSYIKMEFALFLFLAIIINFLRQQNYLKFLGTIRAGFIAAGFFLFSGGIDLALSFLRINSGFSIGFNKIFAFLEVVLGLILFLYSLGMFQKSSKGNYILPELGELLWGEEEEKV